MDIASLLGIVVAVGAVAFAVGAGGGSFAAFVDLPALACVVGGSAAALLLCFPLRTVGRLARVARVAFFRRPAEAHDRVELLVELAEIARREGLLALESRVPEIADPFVVLGVQMVVDGAPPEMIEEVLHAEIDAVAQRHRTGKSLFEQLGKFGPAYGMIGTLLGLVIMLGNMTDPNSIGPGMAVALLTTLYGALLANALFLPLAEKLNGLSRHELSLMEATVRGVLAIQAGDHPWIVARKLNAYRPPERRAAAA